MGWRLPWGLVLCGLAAFPAAAAPGDSAPDCELSAPERGIVAEVLDGETLKLSDGSIVRLVGAKAPRPPEDVAEADWSYSRKTKAALEALANGKPVRLCFGGARTDRHGYLMAQVFVGRDGDGPPLWLQGELVERGLALVYSLSDNAACTDELLVLEEDAREDRRGHWDTGLYSVVSAHDVGRLGRSRGAYQLVEGRVMDVAHVQDWIFLNFEEDWRKDFTVTVDRKQAKRFAERGLDLDGLKGKRIRVRGWLEWRYGPSIKASHPEQIEVLEDAGTAGAAAATP